MARHENFLYVAELKESRSQKIVYVFDMKSFVDEERNKVLKSAFTGNVKDARKEFDERMRYLREFFSKIDGVIFVLRRKDL